MTPEELQAAKLNSTRFWARGCGGIIADQAEIRSTVRPYLGDDDPADFQLDERLRDLWPPAAAKTNASLDQFGQTGLWSIVAELAALGLAVAKFFPSASNAAGVEIVLAGNAIGASRLRLVAPPFASRLW